MIFNKTKIRLLSQSTSNSPSHFLWNSMEQSPSWEVKISQLVEKSPTFCGARNFNTAFTTPRPFYLYFRKSVGSDIQSRLNRQLRLVLETYVYYLNYKWLWSMLQSEEDVVFQYFSSVKKMSALLTWSNTCVQYVSRWPTNINHHRTFSTQYNV